MPNKVIKSSTKFQDFSGSELIKNKTVSRGTVMKPAKHQRRKQRFKANTHEGTIVPATSPPKSLHEGTGRRDLFYEQFTRSVSRKHSQGRVPNIHPSLNSWDQLQRPKLVAATRF